MEERYTLKQLCELTGLSPGFIRELEKEGLISSERRGRRRFYTERELERLKFIKFLRFEMGVNLAGIDIILNMRERMLKMMEEREKFLSELKSRLREELEKRVFVKD